MALLSLLLGIVTKHTHTHFVLCSQFDTISPLCPTPVFGAAVHGRIDANLYPRGQGEPQAADISPPPLFDKAD